MGIQTTNYAVIGNPPLSHWLPEHKYNSLRVNKGNWQEDRTEEVKPIERPIFSTNRHDYAHWNYDKELHGETCKQYGRNSLKHQGVGKKCLFAEFQYEPPDPELKSIYDMEMNTQNLASGERMSSGADCCRQYTLFRRGIPPLGRPYYWKPEPPTNWGLYEKKQEEWKNWKDVFKFEGSLYQKDYKWPKKQSSIPSEAPVSAPYQRNAIPREISTRLVPGNLTNKDWHLRGKPCYMLPVPWRPPIPRWPNSLARPMAVSDYFTDFNHELDLRVAKFTNESLHPAEKWSANLYLY